MATLDRRTFLTRGALAGLTVAGPLSAFSARAAEGRPVRGHGYGRPVPAGPELSLPPGFRYRVIARQGEPMSDGNPTPGLFDGMAAFRGPQGATVLIRNHENRRRAGETPVVVPEAKRYDADPAYNAGVTKLIVSPHRREIASFAVLGGTSTNCAGGRTPWGTWVTCEEVFDSGAQPHGYAYEVDARADGPVDPVPIRAAGRFVHEAVAWYDGALYETEDQSDTAALYRYLPEGRPRAAGDLARLGGTLEALRIVDMPGLDTNAGFPVGETVDVDWVSIETPDPSEDLVRLEAHAKGAAAFDRQEGCWVGNGRIYFDCTDAGAAGVGQIWELDPAVDQLTLIYDFAEALRHDTEFAGACFSPDGASSS